MIITKNMKLKVTDSKNFETDDIKDTIIGYSENFTAIEEFLNNAAYVPEDLANSKELTQGKIIWNRTPQIGDYVGWVNIRTGLHAPAWQPKKKYKVGEIVKPDKINGNVYVCTVEGMSMVNPPLWLIGKGQEFYDANGASWRSKYNYEVGDVVFASNGSRLFFYTCETAGITDENEPVWSKVIDGTTVVDGSVVWRKSKTIKWKQHGSAAEFRPFGKID